MRPNFVMCVLKERKMSPSLSTNVQRTLQFAGSLERKWLEKIMRRFQYTTSVDGHQLSLSNLHEGKLLWWQKMHLILQGLRLFFPPRWNGMQRQQRKQRIPCRTRTAASCSKSWRLSLEASSFNDPMFEVSILAPSLVTSSVPQNPKYKSPLSCLKKRLAFAFSIVLPSVTFPLRYVKYLESEEIDIQMTWKVSLMLDVFEFWVYQRVIGRLRTHLLTDQNFINTSGLFLRSRKISLHSLAYLLYNHIFQEVWLIQ